MTQDSSLSGVLAIQANKYEVDSSDTQGNLTTQGTTTVLYYVRLGKLLSWLEENLLLYNVDSPTATFRTPTVFLVKEKLPKLTLDIPVVLSLKAI